MMDAKLSVANPDEVKLTMTLTMTMKEWVDVRKELSTHTYASMSLRRSIAELVSIAEKHFSQTNHEGTQG